MFVAVVGSLLIAASPASAGDLALDRPASASSTDSSDRDASQANDGNPATRWSSAYADNQWWEVDLGSDRTIDRVELNWEVAYASQYRIRTRTSGSSTWSTAADLSIGSPGVKVHTFAPRSARYVRIQGDARGTQWGISLWDVRVCDNDTCGAPVPEPTPTPTPTPGWTFCSNESERCSFSGTKQVHYGANATWTTPREFTNGVNCSNQVFGDPLPGVTKRCEVRDVPSPTPTPTPDPTPNPGQLPAGVTLRDIDGGLAYYGRFANPLPTSASYFPIGVWGAYNQTPANLDLDAAVGINTYVWVGCDSGSMGWCLGNIRADGRFKVIQEYNALSGVGSETAGWNLGDEIDMTLGSGACLTLAQREATLPEDNRLRYSNFGKGVLIWGVLGYSGHNNTTGSCFVNSVDVASTDLYWHTDPWERSHAQSGNSWGYGWSMERQRMLDALDGDRQPQWGFVEVGKPFTDNQNGGGDTITPAQARGAVWHTLIAGARGIIYFQHSFDGPCPTHHALREQKACLKPMQDAIRGLNAQVKQLAPVLNSPFADGYATGPSAVKLMSKRTSAGEFYVFAASSTNNGQQASITVKSGSSAEVVGENRTVPVTNGVISDWFANGDAVHIYRIRG